MWLLAWLPILACSNGAVESAARSLPAGTPPQVAAVDRSVPAKQLIPAEWTVAQDTSEAGDVTTASLQLPTAKDITGLLDDEAPRLILQCLDGKVEAFIETAPSDPESGPDSSGVQAQPVRIQLDSAPACE
jgi:hypothetical protein